MPPANEPRWAIYIRAPILSVSQKRTVVRSERFYPNTNQAQFRQWLQSYWVLPDAPGRLTVPDGMTRSPR